MRGPPPARPRAGEPVAVPSASTRRVRGGGGPVSRDAGPNSTPGVPLVARRFAPSAQLSELHRLQTTGIPTGHRTRVRGLRAGGALACGASRPARSTLAGLGRGRRLPVSAVAPRAPRLAAPPRAPPFFGGSAARGAKNPWAKTPRIATDPLFTRTGVSGVAPAGYAAPARPKRGSAPDRAARRVLPRAR